MAMFEGYTLTVRAKHKWTGKWVKLGYQGDSVDAATKYAKGRMEAASYGKYAFMVVQWEHPSKDEAYQMAIIHPNGRVEE